MIHKIFILNYALLWQYIIKNRNFRILMKTCQWYINMHMYCGDFGQKNNQFWHIHCNFRLSYCNYEITKILISNFALLWQYTIKAVILEFWWKRVKGIYIVEISILVRKITSFWHVPCIFRLSYRNYERYNNNYFKRKHISLSKVFLSMIPILWLSAMIFIFFKR